MFRFKKIAFPRVSLSLYVNCTTTAIVPPRPLLRKVALPFLGADFGRRHTKREVLARALASALRLVSHPETEEPEKSALPTGGKAASMRPDSPHP